MLLTDLEKYIGAEDLPLIEAMRRIDRNERGLLFIVSTEATLSGCLADGDIRRWIIKNGDLNASVSDVMRHDPIFLFEDEKDKCNEVMNERCLTAIPILDKKNKIIDIVFKTDKKNQNKFSKELGETPVIIMAGGEGSRLRPYTRILPKPLIPVGDVPIIERIIRRFCLSGAREFYLILNYKKGMIKSYIDDSDFRCFIQYVDEEIPSGTAGGIRLIDRQFDCPIIVTNCDVIVDTDYGSVLRYHNESKSDITIVSSVNRTTVPYGVIRTNRDGEVVRIEEKPRLSYCINTGLYVISSKAISLIPEHTFFHMTDLIEKAIALGMKVGMFPVSEESFYDMGEIGELKKMEEWIKKNEP